MRPIADVLRELTRGKTYDVLTAEFAGLVRAVRECGKPGSLSLTITVKPNGDVVAVTDKIAVRMPQADRGATIFFTDAEGGVHRSDPRQQEMALVDGAASAADHEGAK